MGRTDIMCENAMQYKNSTLCNAGDIYNVKSAYETAHRAERQTGRQRMSKARELAELGAVYDSGALSNRNMIVNGAMQCC